MHRWVTAATIIGIHNFICINTSWGMNWKPNTTLITCVQDLVQYPPPPSLYWMYWKLESMLILSHSKNNYKPTLEYHRSQEEPNHPHEFHYNWLCLSGKLLREGKIFRPATRLNWWLISTGGKLHAAHSNLIIDWHWTLCPRHPVSVTMSDIDQHVMAGWQTSCEQTMEFADSTPTAWRYEWITET